MRRDRVDPGRLGLHPRLIDHCLVAAVLDRAAQRLGIQPHANADGHDRGDAFLHFPDRIDDFFDTLRRDLDFHDGGHYFFVQDVFAKFIDATYSQTNYIAQNFIKNGRPMFNEKAYKLLVNQGQKARADLFHYNNPDLIFKAHLQGPSKNPQATTQTFTEVFGG